MNSLELDIKVIRKIFILDVRIMIPDNGITVLIGPSGSGKSTLLRTIVGLETPHDGRICYAEQTWFDSRQGICIPPQQRHVGLVFQEYALFNHMTVARNIGYGLAKKERTRSVSQWLERLRLDNQAHSYPQQLSGGQRQRVAIARAMAHQPALLLLDEPFSSLDQNLRRELRDEFRNLFEGDHCPVLMVTHDLEEARFMADNVGVLVDGKLLAYGPTLTVFNYPSSLQVAEVLGWRNFLPIKRISTEQVEGDWGAVQLKCDNVSNVTKLGIRPEHIRIARRENEGISAVTTRITELGAIRVVECRLKDGTSIELHSPWDEPILAPGNQLRLIFPAQHLRLLTDDRQIMPSHLAGEQDSKKPSTLPPSFVRV